MACQHVGSHVRLPRCLSFEQLLSELIHIHIYLSFGLSCVARFCSAAAASAPSVLRSAHRGRLERERRELHRAHWATFTRRVALCMFVYVCMFVRTGKAMRDESFSLSM